MTPFRRLWRGGYSIQIRITTIATVAILILLTLAGVFVGNRFEAQLITQVDQELVEDADVLQRSIIAGRTNALRRSGALSDLIIQLVDPRGNVVGGTDAGEELPALATPATIEPSGARRLLTVRVDDLGAIRMLVVPLDQRPAVLVVATSIEQADAANDSLQRLLWVSIPIIALLVATLVWWVVGRALRPVEAVRLTVESITEHDRSRRVPTPATDDELSRLVDTMNSMLDRVERGVDRELRFVADASHELRSPLAGARALLETEVDDPSAVIETRAQTLAAVARLEHLVDQMLQLARIEGAGDERGTRRLIDLDELVLAQAGRLRRMTNLEIDTAEVSGGQLRGRDNELGRVIENLTANAVRHARTTIRLTVSEVDGLVRLTVEDDGAGVPPGERSRVFTRFARLDDSRVRDGGGTGLGLAIVESIVTDHGGSIRVEESTLGGASFVVAIPHSLSVVADSAATAGI